MQQLKSKTMKETYALPRINDTIETLLRAKYLSKLDFHSEIRHVKISQDKYKIVSSLSPLGFYEWN